MKLFNNIRERAARATKGPWEKCHHLQSKEKDSECPCGFPGDIWGADKEHVVCSIGPHCEKNGDDMIPRYDRPQELSNADFIAHSRTDIELLLEALDVAIRALEHSRDFDTSAKFGYEYGEKIRGHEPGPGQRFKTPKEQAIDAIKKIQELSDKAK